MQEFLMLFRGGDGQNPNQSPEAMQAYLQKWMDWMEGLNKEGILVGAQPLEAGGKTVKSTKKLVTDGPFMEGKEMVGGYLICRAGTYDEAVEISKGCPILEFDNGIVELRQIQQLHSF